MCDAKEPDGKHGVKEIVIKGYQPKPMADNGYQPTGEKVDLTNPPGAKPTEYNNEKK